MLLLEKWEEQRQVCLDYYKIVFLHQIAKRKHEIMNE